MSVNDEAKHQNETTAELLGDFTEQRDGEAALGVSNKINRTLMDASPFCVEILDISGRVLHISTAGLKARGIDDLGTVLGHKWGRLWSAQSLPDIELALARAICGEVTSFTAYCQTVKGTPKWLEVTVSPILDTDGGFEKMGQILAVSQDITKRKRAEDRLREIETDLRAAFEKSSVAKTQSCAKTRGLVRVNAKFCELTGYSAQELLGRSPLELHCDADSVAETKALEYFFRGVTPTYDVEHRYRRKDGKIIWVHIHSSMLLDAEGQPERTLAVIQDITLKKVVEENLRASEAKVRLNEQRLYRLHRIISDPQLSDLHRLQQLLRLGVEEFNLESGFVAEIANGVYRIELAETPDGSVPVGFSCDAREVMCAETLRRNDLMAIENLAQTDWSTHRAYLEFGTEIYFGVPLPVAGKIYGTLCFTSRVASVREFTTGDHEFIRLLAQTMGTEIARQRNETALKASEERFRSLVTASTQIVWTNSAEGLMQGKQGGWGDFTGQSSEEYQGFGWANAIHPEESQPTIDAWNQAVAEKRKFEFEHRVHRYDGQWRDCAVHAVPILNADGTIREWVGVHTDITDRKRNEYRLRQLADELAENSSRKDEFLATLAHELRNPLAPIRNGLQLMKLAGGNLATMGQAREIMERQLTHMVRLIDDLMDVSRISQGKLQLYKERGSLTTILNTAVETSRPLIDQMGQQFSITLPELPIMVNADHIRLAQVFLNLMNNSAKYSEPGGHIQLKCECQGNEAVVTVVDSGIGIAANHLPYVFEMFAQGNQSAMISQGGLGIGLTIAKRVIELHGGTIEAKSAGEGHGSEFVVRLPILMDELPLQLTVVEKEHDSANKALRILVVDDNRDAAQSLAELLNLMGNDTRTAYDGQAGLDMAQEYRPDVILLDIGMPKLNGYEASKLIRKQPWGKDILLIAATGWGQNQDRDRTLEAGFDYHLVKPIEPQELINILTGLR